MTQPSRGRSDFYQVLVFLILLVLLLVALVVGGGGGQSSVTPTVAPPVTSEVTSEATATVTTEPTAEATIAVTSTATVEVTSESTAAVTTEPTAEASSTATVEATSEATAETTENATPSVRFVSPVDGATVPETFEVVMAATGLTVEPAGDIHPNAGHFHILIDTPFIDAGQIIPKDETHLHFGQGQTSAQITLTPGTHVLRLQFADGAHTALAGDQYRDEITVNVTAGS